MFSKKLLFLLILMESFSVEICAQSLVSVYNLEISTSADRDLTVGVDLFWFCTHSQSSAMTS